MTSLSGTIHTLVSTLPHTVYVSGVEPSVIEIRNDQQPPTGPLRVILGRGAPPPLLRIGPNSYVEIDELSSNPVQFDELTLGEASTLVLNGSADFRSLRCDTTATLRGKPGTDAVARIGSISSQTPRPVGGPALSEVYEIAIVGLEVEVSALQSDGNSFNINHGCTLTFAPVDSVAARSTPGQSVVPPCINVKGEGTLHLIGGLSQLHVLNVKPTEGPEYPLTVHVDTEVEVWEVTGRARFELDKAARVRGNEREGFILLALKGGDACDIQNAALYEFDVKSLLNLAKVRRLHPWWSTEGRMGNTVDACRLVGKTPDSVRRPTIVPYTRNATRWSAIRDILQLSSTRGFDRAISSYLLHDARRIDVRHHAVGVHSFVEEAILNVARLFGYGCRLVRPLLVAMSTSAIVAGALSGMVYAYQRQMVPGGQGSWEVFLALWVDLLFAPISAFRQPDGPTFLSLVVSKFQTEAQILWYMDVAVLTACYGAIVMAFARHLWRRSAGDPM